MKQDIALISGGRGRKADRYLLTVAHFRRRDTARRISRAQFHLVLVNLEYCGSKTLAEPLST